MEIKELEIQTNDLIGTIHFYSTILGLNMIKKNLNSVSFQCGKSILTFMETSESKPTYHFAFNIPKNQIHEAKLWMSSKVHLISNEQNELTTDFETWHAKSIYFLDNNQNILEFIARFDLNNATEANFNVSSILAISEIGIVTDEPIILADQLTKQKNLNLFEKDSQSENFISLGNDNGLLILVKRGRKWYPTNQKAEQHYLKICLGSEKIIFYPTPLSNSSSQYPNPLPTSLSSLTI